DDFRLGNTVTVVLDGDDVVVAKVDTTPAATRFYAIAVSRSSSGVTFERADGSEFFVAKGELANDSPTEFEDVTVGSVYRIETKNDKVSISAPEATPTKDVGVVGTLETIGSTYIRVKKKEGEEE